MCVLRCSGFGADLCKFLGHYNCHAQPPIWRMPTCNCLLKCIYISFASYSQTHTHTHTSAFRMCPCMCVHMRCRALSVCEVAKFKLTNFLLFWLFCIAVGISAIVVDSENLQSKIALKCKMCCFLLHFLVLHFVFAIFFLLQALSNRSGCCA